MLTLNDNQLRYLRLRANGLVGRGLDGDVAQVVQRVCGLQAQERAAAELAVQPRSAAARKGALSRGDVGAALDAVRTVARTWAMRSTIHMLAAEDVGWLLGLLGPVFVTKGRRRRRELGLDEAICARATAAMERILGQTGPLTRGELLQRLAVEDIPVEGQAGYHLIARAGLQGVVCFGPDRDGEHTFALVEDWLGPVAVTRKHNEDEALAELLRRYLRAFGPASVYDFARWSGLGVREARRALTMNKDLLLQLASEAANGEEIVMLPEQEAWLEESHATGVDARLLPAYDSFLLGYADRGLVVPQEHAKQVHPGGGVINATVLVAGLAVGNWRLRRKTGGVQVEVETWQTLAPEQAAAVEQETMVMRGFLTV